MKEQIPMTTPDHLNPTVLALERTIAGMEQQIEALKEERDEWCSVAEEFQRVTLSFAPPRWLKKPDSAPCKALAEFDRLTRSAKAKGGGE